MDKNNNPDEGICILSLDNGGSETFAQLLLIKHYMGRLAAALGYNEDDLFPGDYFDLMGGVGFGGLVVFMLGYLRMTVNQATDKLLSITTVVFPHNSSANGSPETNMKNLRSAIEDLLESRGIGVDTKIYDKTRPPSKCKVVLYATTSADVSQPMIFRTYSRRGSGLNPTIVEALCATMATPSLFSPVKIGPHLREQTFVGGPLGANNPTRELLKEAAAAFGDDKRVSQILSLGASTRGAISLSSLDTAGKTSSLMGTLASDCEMVASELSTRLFNVDAYVRLNMDGEVKAATMDDWIGPAAIESKARAFVATTAVTRALEESVQYLQSRVGTATLGQINLSSTTRVTVKTVPAVSPYYVVRKKAFSSMVNHLTELPSSSQKIFAITGMGGCGKTQMVSYFLQEKETEYIDVVYADASSNSSLKADLQAWARSVGVGHEHDVWEDALRMLAGGVHEGRWILVLDNADDPTLDLVPFIPKCYHGTVVITSRNRDVGNLSNTHHLELGEMETEEALSALLRAARREPTPSPEEKVAALELVELLGCLAVALVQAGAYCHQLSSTAPFTFSQYVSIFLAQRAEMMKRETPASLDSYQRGAYTAFDLSYKAIPQVAKDLLHFMASFHPSNIPLAMFGVAAAHHFTDPGEPFLPRPEEHSLVVTELEALLCPEGEWSEVQAHDTIHVLRSFSLISASSVMNLVFLHLHPLVQAWARDILPSRSQTCRKMAVQVITSCNHHDHLLLYQYLLPHIRDLLDVYASDGAHIEDQFAAGNILANQSNFGDAENLYKCVLETLRLAGGHDDVEAIKVATVLASTYRDHGKWSEAERVQLEVLEQRKRLFGVEHPDTITAAQNLALTYSAQGRYKEAEELELQALERLKQVRGEEHVEVTNAISNLAATYTNTGRYSEAETLQLQVLEQWTRLRGKDHPYTINAMGNLAVTYSFQGRSEEAEKLQRDVLKEEKRLMGPDHLSTIQAAHNLATTYMELGRHGEAEELVLDVLERSKRLLGKDHIDAIDAKRHLVGIYSRQGRADEAYQLSMEVVEQRRRLQRKDEARSVDETANIAAIYSSRNTQRKEAHDAELRVLTAMEELERRKKEYPPEIYAAYALAETYRSQRQFDEAEKVLVEILERQRRVLGDDDPVTIRVIDQLASTYVSLGRHKDAEPLEVEVLERRRRVLGAEHRDTLFAMASLASTYSTQGKSEEAEKLQLDLLELRKRLNGEDDPFTIRAAWNLAVYYNSQQRYSEAEPLMLEVVEKRRKVLGTEHLDTIFAAENLARSYDHQKRWIEAEKLDLEVLELRRRVQGNDHPDTIRAAGNLGSTYHSLGRIDEAEKLMLEIVEQRRRLLGKDHPNTISSMVKLGVRYAKTQEWTKSEALFTEIVASSLTTFGKQHPRTQVNLATLIFILKMLGNSEKVEEMKMLVVALETPQ